MKFQFNNSSVTINVTQAEFEKFGDALVAGETTIPVNTFTLTDKQLYMLNCILHHVQWNGEIVSLLEVFASDKDSKFTNEDYDQVQFSKDVFGDTSIKFVSKE